MAGNNSIQFLRGTQSQIASSTEVALVGQPVFATDTNQLYVGDGTTEVRNLNPISSTVVKTSSEWKYTNYIIPKGCFGFDSTNNELRVGDGTSEWADLDTVMTTPNASFDSSWSKIAQVVRSGGASRCFKLGDTKSISINSVTYSLRVIDITDSSLTVELNNVLSTLYPMNNSALTYAMPYSNTTMATTTLPSIFNELPTTLKSVLNNDSKSLKLFKESDFSTFAYYKRAGASLIKRRKQHGDATGTAYPYWLQDTATTTSTMRYSFAIVNAQGSIVKTKVNEANTNLGVTFYFTIQ